jgi:hypothetical protein
MHPAIPEIASDANEIDITSNEIASSRTEMNATATEIPSGGTKMKHCKQGKGFGGG